MGSIGVGNETPLLTEEASAETVQEFLRANVVPARRAEPRLAAGLASVNKQHVQSAQGMVAVWRRGHGPAVLLVHGWEDDNSLWGLLNDALVERGRALVVLDHSADDERAALSDSQEVLSRCRRGELVVVDGLSHRKTAREPEVVARIADFVSETRHLTQTAPSGFIRQINPVVLPWR